MSISGYIQVTAIPAFTDNYLWLLDNGAGAAVVDPGDAEPVLQALAARQLPLEYILLTHHHMDHTGGVNTLLQHFDVPVIGPASEHIPQVTRPVADGDRVEILGLQLQVIAVPGHTLDHIAYFQPPDGGVDAPLLFCGDTLFAGGCGRVFEGTFPQMRQSLARLKALPENTMVYCAHEYTQANLNFALAVEPGNKELQQRHNSVLALRAKSRSTVPSSLGEELSTNPFLRYDNPAVIAAAEQRENNAGLSEDEVFASIRSWKDNF